MSEEKKERAVRKTVNLTDLSDDKVAEASKLRFDADNSDGEMEGKFSIEIVNVPDTDKSSTRIEMHGNREAVITAIIATVEQDEQFRNFMFSLVDSVMIARI